MKKMKIAVTGATGGLGRSLAEDLLQNGHEVVTLGRNEKVGKILRDQGAEFYAGEISDETYVMESLKGCDAVVHSAGLASPWGAWEDFFRINVTGTANVLKAMEVHNIKKLVHLSSPSIYFSGKPFEMIKEDSPLPVPQTFYAKSKIMADDLVRDEVKKSHISAVLLRPRSIIGKYDNTILPRLLQLMEKGIFPLPGGGKARVDFVAVENVVHAIKLILESEKNFPAIAMNITNDEPTTVRHLLDVLSSKMNLKVKYIAIPLTILVPVAGLLEKIADHITKKEPKMTRYTTQSIAVTQTLSIDRAKEMIGYRPVISLEEAVDKFIRERKARS
jgi:nucleoside-diphosphate-sugar epimerase